jgi:preprotein translocase subunit SecB
MNQKLQDAIESLIINDVYIKESISKITDGFEPKYNLSEDDDNVIIRFKHTVIKSDIIELESEDKKQDILRVFIDLGIKWVNIENADQNEFLAQIEAVYISEYLITKKISQESIDEFALKNSSFHVWPYWREFLSSTCQRMCLPKIMLPTTQFASNSKDK